MILWDVAERARAAELRGDHVAVHSVAFGPDGELLATGNADGAVVLWDVAERAESATLDADVMAAEHALATEPTADYVTGLAFSADGTLATGTFGGAVVLWDPVERSRIATLAPTSYDREQHQVDALAFAPDGATLVVAQRTAEPGQDEVDEEARTHHGIAIYDPRTQRLEGLLEAGAFGVGDVAFSPTGDTLAIGEDFNAITLLDPSVRPIIADGTIDQIALGRDGRTLAIGDDSGHVGVWDLSGPRRVQRLGRRIEPHETLALHPGGRHAALIGNDAVALHPLPVADEEQVLRISLSDDDATARRRLQGLVTLDAEQEIVTAYGAKGPPTGRRVPGIRGGVLSPDRDVLATQTTSGVRLWAMPELTAMGALGTPDQFTTIPLVAFGPDGTTLATVDNGVVTLWDVRKRTPITSFTERKPPVDIAIAPDNRTVALALDDAVSVWDAVERVRIAANLPVTYSGRNQVLFTDDGSALLATDGARIRSWDLDPRRITTRICSTLDRSLTRQEWEEFIPERPYRATCS